MSETSRRAAVTAALVILGAIAAAAAYRWWPTGPRQARDARFGTESIEIDTGGGPRRLEVEVATTPEQQALGLMFRTSLADDRGMLFLHDSPSELRMWMRNTYIPLDMVFIRADGTIHRIEAHAVPLSEQLITSDGPVTGVLELAGGAAGRLGLKPGDRVKHPHFATARR